ncbi:MAG: cell division protein FtsZ [Epsilonproteobacteria bacterium]|nr:cell division protein FtsZ [Campylobacterota bacterium]
MANFNIEEQTPSKTILGARIKVVGVGGGGGNMINHMKNIGINNIELIAANTDAQALNLSKADVKLQLGEKKTKGLGAGMIPEVGKEAALESYEEIKNALKDSDIVFIAAGLGGGTGTGAAPVIAQAAKELGALTVSIVTKPFRFEGRKRAKLAKGGIEELKKESDSIVIIPNDKLLSIVDKNLGIKESFKLVDEVLSRAVNGMSAVVLNAGENNINLDFADVQTVMSHRGMALMGIGESRGDNAAIDAIKSAIESPLLDNMSIKGAMGVLIHFQMHPNFPLMQVNEAMDEIESSADEDADIIFGTTYDDTMEEDAISITIIATGFEGSHEEEESKKNEMHLLNQSSHTKNKYNQMRKVSGGYEGKEDILDIPTFLRNQMD